MKDLSAVILSSKSSSKKLEKAFKDISRIAEEELWISIELVHGSNSFWMATPEEEISEDEFTGIIDIGDDQSIFEKIMSLSHEIGHAIHSRDEHFKDAKETMFSESLAWFLGYKWCAHRGFVIDMSEYKEMMSKCLKLYMELE
jgi:hypothetical protein